ncbi:unnamed protein product, partial [Mesorhabditis belari]|uniref:Protein AATF n=1 Tax=Mesorhabditis belari TaxID=2138241 RepID=A0AAF3FE95_9BILA
MSFLKELEALCDTAPEIPDTEAFDAAEDSLPKKSANDERIDGDHVKLRRRIGGIELLDERYKGAKVNTADVFEDAYEPRRLAAMNGKDVLTESDDESNATSGHGEISDEDASELDEEESFEDEEIESENAITEDEEESISGPTILQNGTSENKEKAAFVQRQLKIFDQLLYTKIRLHAAMRSYNELPRGKLAQTLVKDADEATKKRYGAAKQNARRLMNLLIEAETALLSGCKQTKLLLDGTYAEGSDEEIESSEDEASDDNDDEKLSDEGDDNFSENDESDEDQKPKANSAAINNKGRSWQAAARTLTKIDNRFNPYRRSTIEKWDERTRLVSSGPARQKDFSHMEDTAMGQIEKIMRDKNRLLRRTRINRSNLERIGKTNEAKEDLEFFDDNDFYHVMLKELLDKRTDQTLDSAAMTRQWLELQKYREKRSKKKVDTKASKGRKIRYKAIPKLVNFFPAVPESVTWSHEKRNDLFNTLFT